MKNENNKFKKKIEFLFFFLVCTILISSDVNALDWSRGKAWYDNLYCQLIGCTMTGNLTASDSLLTNYIYSEGAGNNISIDGNTLFIDDGNDRVGIGTATPNDYLHILTTNTGNQDMLSLEAAYENVHLGPALKFIRTNGVLARIRGVEEGSWDGGLAFEVFLLNGGEVGRDSATTEAMRIDQYGNVGIGTTSPSNKLDVRGDGNFSGTVYINNATDLSETISSTQINNSYALNITLQQYIDWPGGNLTYVKEDAINNSYAQIDQDETFLGNVEAVEFKGKFNWTSGDDWNAFDGSELLFNESKLATQFFNVSTIEVITGTPQGAITDIHSYNNIPYNISEVASDLELRLNFTGINSFNEIIIRYKSPEEVGGTHVMAVQMYHVVDESWEDYGELPNSDIYHIIEFGVFDEDAHIDSTGTVQLRFYQDEGTPARTHKHEIDWVTISKGFGTPTGEEVDPHAVYKDGTTQLIGNWNAGSFNISVESIIGDGSYLTNIPKNDLTEYVNETKWSNGLLDYINYTLWASMLGEYINDTQIASYFKTSQIVDYPNSTQINVSLSLQNECSEITGCIENAITVDTSATENCTGSQAFLGNGSCIDIDGINTDTTIGDTNASTECSGDEALLGNTTCFSIGDIDTDTNTITTLDNIVFDNGTNLPSDWDISNYTAGDGNLTITEHVVSLVYTELKSWLDDIYQAAGDYLTSQQANDTFIISADMNTLAELNTQISGDLASSAELNNSYARLDSKNTFTSNQTLSDELILGTNKNIYIGSGRIYYNGSDVIWD